MLNYTCGVLRSFNYRCYYLLISVSIISIITMRVLGWMVLIAVAAVHVLASIVTWEMCLGLIAKGRCYLVLLAVRGAQYRRQNSVVLVSGTPRKFL